MKAFTKDFTHKALDRLKAKGKLKKIPTNGSTPSRPHHLSTSSRRPDGTPNEAGTNGSPSSTATGTVIATPQVLDTWTPLSDRDKAEPTSDLVMEMLRDDDEDESRARGSSMRMDIDGPATPSFGPNGNGIYSSPVFQETGSSVAQKAIKGTWVPPS